MIIWQSKSQIGSKVVTCTINAIGSCKTYTNAIFTLLEATIYNYFRTLGNRDVIIRHFTMFYVSLFRSDSTKNFHTPTWTNVLARLNYTLPLATEGKDLIRNELFLCLHVYSICKLNQLSDAADKITFLQLMHRHLEGYKIRYTELGSGWKSFVILALKFCSEQTEGKIAMIWGLIVACGHQLLNVNDNSKGQLITLGGHLQTISNQSDGWGDGLLGAIGLKKDGFSKKCVFEWPRRCVLLSDWQLSIWHFRLRLLTKCLSCIVFSLFPDVRYAIHLVPCSAINRTIFLLQRWYPVPVQRMRLCLGRTANYDQFEKVCRHSIGWNGGHGHHRQSAKGFVRNQRQCLLVDPLILQGTLFAFHGRFVEFYSLGCDIWLNFAIFYPFSNKLFFFFIKMERNFEFGLLKEFMNISNLLKNKNYYRKQVFHLFDPKS